VRLLTRGLRLLFLLATTTSAFLWQAANAQALVSCGYDAAFHGVSVSLTADTDSATLVRSGDAISVNGANCGAATVNNTDTIWISGGFGSRSLTIDLSGGQFAPGATAESAGTSEIEIFSDLGPDPSLDSVIISGGAGADNIRVGTNGVNLNGDDDADVFFNALSRNFQLFSVLGAGGDDNISAAGDLGTGSPWLAAITLDGGVGNDTVTGGAGPDTLIGGDGNDTLNGGSGNETISGNDGNDTLSGGAGNDTISGGNGDDIFNEGAAANGADVFLGGAGSDTVSYSERTNPVSVTLDATANDGEEDEGDNASGDIENATGGGGGDTLVGSSGANALNGGPGNDAISGGAGNDTLSGGEGNDIFTEDSSPNGADVFIGGAGEDTVSYALRMDPVTVTIDDVANDGGQGEADNVPGDVEDIVGGSENDTITGSAFANELTGGPGNDTLNGGGGTDSLHGGPGDDVENGDTGDDIFLEDASANGADVFVGGPGLDTVSYAERTNSVKVTLDGKKGDGETGEGDLVSSDVENAIGGSGNDAITGSKERNVLRGSGGNDRLNGADGNDVLDGGRGNDTESGGNGNDTFVEGAAKNGADVFSGGAGTDTVSYSERTDSVTVTIDGTANDGEEKELDNLHADVECINGGSGDDKLVGSAAKNTLRGNAGGDLLSGLGGNDRLDGGDGDDTESGGAGNDTFVEGRATNGSDVFQGGPGIDTVSYANRRSALKVTIDRVANDGAVEEADNVKLDVENLIGGSGKDTLVGSAAANVLSGGNGNDLLRGGAGNDRLIGGPGRDKLLGGAGNDIFFAGDKQADIVDGGSGKDVARTYDRKLDKLISIP